LYYLQSQFIADFKKFVSNIETIEENNEIRLYPNPANDFVNIEMEVAKDIPCYIYSLLGERLLATQINSANQTIDVSRLPANIYLLQIGNQIIKLIKTQ